MEWFYLFYFGTYWPFEEARSKRVAKPLWNDAFWSSQTAKVFKSRESLQPPSVKSTGLIGLIGRGKFRPSEPNTHPWLGLEFMPCLPPKGYRNSSFPYLLFCGLQLAHRQLTHTYLPLQGAFACKSHLFQGPWFQCQVFKRKTERV